MIGVRRTKQLCNTESQLVTILLRSNPALDLDIGLDGKKDYNKHGKSRGMPETNKTRVSPEITR
jgi:hypothetical protein